MNKLITFCLLVFSSCTIFPKSVRNLVYFPNQIRSADLRVSEEGPKKLQDLENKADFLALSSEALLGEEATSSGAPNLFNAYDVGIRGDVNAIALDPSGKKSDVFVGGQDGSLVKVSPKNGSYKLIARGEKPIISLSVSPDGKYLAVSQFSLVSLVDLGTLNIIAQLTQVKGRILSLAWHPKSEYLLIGRADGSVMAWNLPEDKRYAENSTDSLEIYETESSPVTHVRFHPSGRAFFAANQLGGVFLVRLRKTEKELGIDEVRSTFAFMDEGTYVVKIAKTAGPINEFFLTSDGEKFFTISNDGSVESWLVRGLQPQPVILLDKDSALSLNYFKGAQDKIGHIITTGRALKVKIWCSRGDVYTPLKPTDQVVNDTAASDSQFDSTNLSEDDLIKFLEQKTKTVSEQFLIKTRENGDKGLLFSSTALKESISEVEVSDSTGLMWIGEKTGKIVSFDVKGLLATREFSVKVNTICG